MLVLQYRPVFDRVALAVRASFGWPATILVSVLCGAFSALSGVKPGKWHSLSELPHFLPTVYWLVGAAVSRPALEVVVRFHINSLTLRHYEQRAMEAHRAQTVLRGIVAAARAAERERKEREATQKKEKEACQRQRGGKGIGRTADIPDRSHLSRSLDSLPSVGALPSSRLPVEGGVVVAGAALTGAHTSEPEAQALTASEQQDGGSSAVGHSRGSNRWARFFVQLDGLSGALEFGAGLDDAQNLDQARVRASRIFGILRLQPKLVLQPELDGHNSAIGIPTRPQGGRSALGQERISRSELIHWTVAHTGSDRDSVLVGEQALFQAADESLDEATFVSSIERELPTEHPSKTT